MADSPLDVAQGVARAMDAVAAAMAAATKKAMRGVASDARKEMTRQARVVPGGDARFSNMARYNHGGRLAVKTTVRDDEVFVMSKGPWKIAEEGASPHRMGRGVHPGTRSTQGRRSWTVGERAVLDSAEHEVPAALTDGVEAAFLKG